MLTTGNRFVALEGCLPLKCLRSQRVERDRRQQHGMRHFQNSLTKQQAQPPTSRPAASRRQYLPGRTDPTELHSCSRGLRARYRRSDDHLIRSGAWCRDPASSSLAPAGSPGPSQNECPRFLWLGSARTSQPMQPTQHAVGDAQPRPDDVVLTSRRNLQIRLPKTSMTLFHHIESVEKNRERR